VKKILPICRSWETTLKVVIEIERHLNCHTKKPNRKTHIKKQKLHVQYKKKHFLTLIYFLVNQRDVSSLVHPTPSTHGALVMIHLYDPLGKKNVSEKVFLFFIEQIGFFCFLFKLCFLSCVKTYRWLNSQIITDQLN
jgi:hypothetical protein